MELNVEPLNNFLGRYFGITEDIVIQWAIIIVIAIAAIVLTKDLKKIPDKKQNVVEIFVDSINNLVISNMGEKCKGFVSYIGTLVLFLLFMNLTGLFGVEPPTKDFNIVLGVALITFLVIQVYAIKKQGIKGYFIGYAKPIIPLLPINIMERVMLPISLSLRLFGNITAATVIMKLIYDALGKTPLGIAQLGLPVPFHFYFDVFDGSIQMLIFVMLTMINIKVISEH
ncbi:F0F1 ATP synthase subunit A [Clostridium ganghwense]|uniref:ATP synthase subunit a n=1 Tax=Clostridium ganghwense TaxID=312089 RepID=A0ABT4CNM3_9CLOT|nr:F0F1 ATP synthase subunit A [Clostridium ganghwense]MCY6369821.1 F0F1 ATP synthase subunit A [Clostridium ganghwense]